MLRRNLAMRACAAAVAGAFSFQAFAQSSLEQALGNNGEAIRTYNQIQVGLERAQRQPLETVWLRAEVLEDLWQRNPALSQMFQGCDKTGSPKQGCMVSGRTFWRFTLAPSFNAFAPGLSAQAFRASPPESEALPASGGVFLVANGASIGQRGGAVVLAAGATAQLIDTAFPSVVIEVSAPKDEDLLLGNLAGSDIGKAIALLTRQAGNATVASLDNGGRVTLHRNGVVPRPATQLAAVAPKLIQTDPRLDDWSASQLTIEPIQVAAVAPTLIPAEPRLDDWSASQLTIEPIQVAAIAPTLIPAEPRFDDWSASQLTIEPIQVAAIAPTLIPAEPRLDDWSASQMTIEPVQVAAAIAPKPIVVAVIAPAPSASGSEIARMRAEIEAEVARENARLAQTLLQGRTGTTRRFGT